MAKTKRAPAATVLAISIGLLILGGYLAHRYFTQGVHFSIKNNTQDALADISVGYTGGVLRIASLEPNASYSRHINPTSESHLDLTWSDPAGVKHAQAVDVYFEPNYRGRIAVTIAAHGRISWRDEVTTNLY